MDDDGSNYLIFGTFSYFIAKLNDDMVSLNETGRGVHINDLQHSDDKPFIHKVHYTPRGVAPVGMRSRLSLSIQSTHRAHRAQTPTRLITTLPAVGGPGPFLQSQRGLRRFEIALFR
jgi:hypothetical protein